MKKNIYVKLMCAGTLALMLTACSSGTSTTADAETTAEASAETEEAADSEADAEESSTEADETTTAEGAVTVTPEANSLGIDGSQDDVTFAVSFTADDITREGDTYSISYTAYAEEAFDNYAVEALKAGDTIVLGGESVLIDSIEIKDGFVTINGGIEEGGYELMTTDDMFYYQIGMSDIRTYETLGEAVLPVSADCVITDSSENPEEAKTITMEDVISSQTPFYEQNTTITVNNGEIVEITRAFMP